MDHRGRLHQPDHREDHRSHEPPRYAGPGLLQPHLPRRKKAAHKTPRHATRCVCSLCASFEFSLSSVRRIPRCSAPDAWTERASSRTLTRTPPPPCVTLCVASTDMLELPCGVFSGGRQVSLARYVLSFFIFFALTLTLPIVRWKDSRARIMQIHSRKMNYKPLVLHLQL